MRKDEAHLSPTAYLANQFRDSHLLKCDHSAMNKQIGALLWPTLRPIHRHRPESKTQHPLSRPPWAHIVADSRPEMPTYHDEKHTP